jgi:hypothetical protein
MNIYLRWFVSFILFLCLFVSGGFYAKSQGGGLFAFGFLLFNLNLFLIYIIGGFDFNILVRNLFYDFYISIFVLIMSFVFFVISYFLDLYEISVLMNLVFFLGVVIFKRSFLR